jgi:hypothetical protein
MLKNPSLITRIVVGKSIGFLFGLSGLIFLPYFLPDIGWMERLGILFWYTTVGAVVGMAGVMTWHPVLRLPMPWWIRAPVIGAWMNFVLVFFAHELMTDMMVSVFGADGVLQSPFWFVSEGALVGLVIGYFATRLGGEGPATVTE